MVSEKGLENKGETQVFRWEKVVQEAFVSQITRSDSRVLNIGLGAGYAHDAFLKKAAYLRTIENDPHIINRYRRFNRKNCNDAILTNDWWKMRRDPVLSEFDTVYFDAIEVKTGFTYKKSNYVNDLKKCLDMLKNSRFLGRLFCVAFHPPPAGLKFLQTKEFRPYFHMSLPRRIEGLPPLLAVLYYADIKGAVS